MKFYQNLLRWQLAAVSLMSLASADTIFVNTTQDQFDTPSGNIISLREAVRDLSNAGGGTICFNGSLGPIELDRQIAITEASDRITIDATTVGRPQVITLTDDSTEGLALIFTRSDLTLRNVLLDGRNRVRFGLRAFGGDIRLVQVEMTRADIAIIVDGSGSLNLNSSYFHHNRVGAQLSNFAGAEIFSCLFAFQDQAMLMSSLASGIVRVRNCTIAENGWGRNLASISIATNISPVVLAYNSFVDNNGYALSGPPDMALEGNLFARNSLEGEDGPKLSLQEGNGRGATSAGYNLSDHNSPFLDHAEDIITSITNISRLGDYGGALMCCFPVNGSPAIDNGNESRAFPQVFVDTRGFSRQAKTPSNDTGNVMDIGAVETNPHGTLVVTNDNASGPGSLPDIVAQATEETNHIVIGVGIGAGDIDLNSTLVFGGGRNYNLVGNSFNRALTTSGDFNLIRIDSGSESDTSVSFEGLEISGISYDQQSGPKAVIQVNSKAKASFHRCVLKDNQTIVRGTIYVAGGGKLFLNETEMENCGQIKGADEPSQGGGAIHSRGRVTAWNSLFLNNRALSRNDDNDPDADGGAVYLGTSSRGVFRRCSFFKNRARRSGGAVFFESNATEGYPYVFDHCTFRQNDAGNGAIGIMRMPEMAIDHCLFHQNMVNGSLTVRPENRDLFIFDDNTVNLVSSVGNWTDSPEVSADFIAPERRGAALRFAPFARWGGRTRTQPLVFTSAPAREQTVFFSPPSSPRDAHNEPSVESYQNSNAFVVTPGAVQARLDQNEILSTEILGFNANGDLRIKLGGKSGLTWRVYTSTGLNNFQATNQTVTFSILTSSIVVPVPTPVPSQFFVQLRPETPSR